jgi:hypothetical protein
VIIDFKKDVHSKLENKTHFNEIVETTKGNKITPKDLLNEIGLGSENKSKTQKALTGEMIKEVCVKLKIDRLGNITK